MNKVLVHFIFTVNIPIYCTGVFVKKIYYLPLFILAIL